MKPKKLSLFVSSIVLAASAIIPSAYALTNGTWATTASGNWNATTNWTDTNADTIGDVADGVGATADFSTLDLPAAFTTVTLDGSHSIGALTFGDTNTATVGSWALSGATPNVLTLATSSGKPTITANVITNINTGFVLDGTNGFIKAGSGILRFFTNSTTLTGDIDLNAGTLAINRVSTGVSATIGSGAVNMAHGTTFRLDNGNASHSNNPINVAAGGTVKLESAAAGNSFTGAVSSVGGSTTSVVTINSVSVNLGSNNVKQLDSFYGTVDVSTGMKLQWRGTISGTGNGGDNVTLNVTGTGRIDTKAGGNIALGALTGDGVVAGSETASSTVNYTIGKKGVDAVFSGTIVDAAVGRSAAVTKVGAGIQTLSGANTYSGSTVITEGTLKINGTKSGGGATTVNGTTTVGTLAGTGSVSGTTTVALDGRLAPGDSNVASGIGTITLSNLVLSTGSHLDLQFGAGNDKVTIASGGALTIGSGVKVNVGGFGTVGTYPIINYTGAIATSGLTVENPDPSKIYSFTSDGTAISLVISATDPSNYWAVDGNGAWGVAANWSKILVPNAPSALAIFGPYIGGVSPNTFGSDVTTTLDAVRTVGDLRFDDGGFSIRFTLAPGTAGSLAMNNGAGAASISFNLGTHTISAPVSVASPGLILDASTSGPANSLTLSGVISGASAALTKTGAGTVTLTGNNTFGGGITLVGGVVQIDNLGSLGSAAATFKGGTVSIANDILTDARAYTIFGANNANFDTNGFNYGLTTGIAPLSGATGGLNKIGTGNLTLSAAQTYTGATTVSGGELIIDAGGSVTSGSINTATGGGGLVHVRNGGTISAATGTLNPQSAGLFMDTGSGNVSFSGTLLATNSSSNISGAPVRVSNGTLTAPTIQVGRSNLITDTEPTGAPINTNLYLTGGAVNVSGNLIIGAYTGSSAPQSSSVTRLDGGILTVGGAISIGLNNGGRWSYLDINGGTLVNTGAVVDSGVVLGGPLVGKAAFLMRAGTATVERIQFGRGAVDGQGLIKITGGDLYVGSGGIQLGSTGVYTSEIRLAGGNLSAKADWASPAPVTLAGGTINAADATTAAHNIALAGVVSGTDLIKTGSGILTLAGANTYTGTTTVTAGTLAITGDNSLATGAVTVASGATLGGNGNIGGNVTIQSGAHHALAVAATSGAQVTRVITGTLNLDSGNVLDLTAAVTPAAGTYTLATASSIVGTPTTVNYNGITGTASVVGGNTLVVTITGSAYGSWATAKGLTGANNGATQDPESDGISNALEFVLGGNPLVSDTSKLPVLTTDTNNFIFTFNRADESEAEIGLTFQYGSTLTGWSDVAVGAVGAGQVAVTENGASPDTVVITVPKTSAVGGKLFGRLKAVK